MTDLVEIAKNLVVAGKGILAADESTGTADKRLMLYGIPGGPEMRYAFRDLFLNAPGIEEYLSGVILFEESLPSFAKPLIARGIAAGIKVDEGTEPFSESPKELITKGLIGLAERLVPYKEAGATFTKWRAVITIDGDTLPSAGALVENAKRLASYAKIVQEAGMVPILEPEVLHTGKHSRLRAKAVITDALAVLFKTIDEQAVDRTALIIKTSMALSGADGGGTDTPEQVAEDTLDALIEAVPKDVPGIVFLSGGQSPDEATNNLRAIRELAAKRQTPWPLTFSYARALQEEALAIWKGKPENVEAARAAYLARLKSCHL